MSIILSHYLYQYQRNIRREAERISLARATMAFAQNYGDHTREVIRHLDLLHRYQQPSQRTLALRWRREAQFLLLLAFEDVSGLGYLAQLHPSKRSFIEHQSAHHRTQLLDLERSFTTIPVFSPPPRSA